MSSTQSESNVDLGYAVMENNATGRNFTQTELDVHFIAEPRKYPCMSYDLQQVSTTAIGSGAKKTNCSEAALFDSTCQS